MFQSSRCTVIFFLLSPFTRFEFPMLPISPPPALRWQYFRRICASYARGRPLGLSRLTQHHRFPLVPVLLPKILCYCSLSHTFFVLSYRLICRLLFVKSVLIGLPLVFIRHLYACCLAFHWIPSPPKWLFSTKSPDPPTFHIGARFRNHSLRTDSGSFLGIW